MMDINLSYNSDSTYCSLYENMNGSEKRKYRTNKLTDTKVLDKVHKEVIHHLEGKHLLGRVEVVQYMRQISKMKLKNCKDQCFAEKIQLSLLKIYNLTKQFERSLSIGNISPLLDHMESYSCTDFKILNAGVDDPKQILLQSTSVNDEKSSFPLTMLTNDNFISSFQDTYTSINKPSLEQKKILESQIFPKVEDKVEPNSSDLFSLENSDIYLRSCSSVSSREETISGIYSQNCTEGSNLDKTVHCSKDNIVLADSIKDHENILNYFNESANNHISSTHRDKILSQDDAKEHTECFINELNEINSEECDTMLQISKLCDDLSIKHTSTPTELFHNANFVSKNSLPTTVTNFNLKIVTDLGNLFNESYNTKIYNLCYGTENNFSKKKSWPEIECDFTSGERLVRNVRHTLNELFEKLHIEEFGTNQIKCMKILANKDIHNFKEEDNIKLRVEDLMNTNKVRLEQISEEFQIYLNARQEPIEEDDDFQILNWRSFLD